MTGSLPGLGAPPAYAPAPEPVRVAETKGDAHADVHVAFMAATAVAVRVRRKQRGRRAAGMPVFRTLCRFPALLPSPPHLTKAGFN